jgi:hypothetical protein
VSLERGRLILVSTTEELLGRKSSGSCLESREYGRRDPLRWPRRTLYLQTLALTSATSSGRSVSIVRSRTQATEDLSMYIGTAVLLRTPQSCTTQRQSRFSLEISNRGKSEEAIMPFILTTKLSFRLWSPCLYWRISLSTPPFLHVSGLIPFRTSLTLFPYLTFLSSEGTNILHLQFTAVLTTNQS